jgi:hypothetical protein
VIVTPADRALAELFAGAVPFDPVARGPGVSAAAKSLVATTAAAQQPLASGMVQRVCKNCRDPFQARAADVRRGWALYCSKSCKAVKQEQHTGQHRAYLERRDEGYDGMCFPSPDDKDIQP